MEPMFSVIIPVYNVEKYLSKCVWSVINQTYRNIEIILVDDGSPDECPQICDEFANQDLRIKVVHKSNEGLSEARNTGMRMASGQYVMFLDSDDSFEEFACEKFAVEIEKQQYPDIVVGQVVKIYNDEKEIINPYLNCENVINGGEFLTKYLENRNFFCMLTPGNIYKRSFLLEYNLFFTKNLLHEDERWTPITFLRANTVISVRNEFYNYFIRENSITTKKR